MFGKIEFMRLVHSFSFDRVGRNEASCIVVASLTRRR